MKFGHIRRLVLGCITLAAAVTGHLLMSGHPRAAAQALCSGVTQAPLVLNTITYSSGEDDALCYPVTMPAFTARVEIAFNPFLEGSYDLYWSRGSDVDLIASDLVPSQDAYVLTVTSYRPASSDRNYTLAVVPKSASPSGIFAIGVFAKDTGGAIVNASAGADSGTGNLGTAPAGGKTISVAARSSASSRFSAGCGIISIQANWLGNPDEKKLQLVLYDPANRPVRTVPVGRATGDVFTIVYPVSPDQVKSGTTWTVKYVNNGTTGASVYPHVSYPKGACPEPKPDSSGRTTISLQNGRHPTGGYAGAHEAVLSQAQPNASDKSKGCLADGDDPPGTGRDKATLLYWDVETIPDGVRVVDASITLGVFNETEDTYYLYGLNRPWDGDRATWNRARRGQNWQSPGAQGRNDRDSTILGELRGAARGPAVIKLNSTGRSLLESWINGTKLNSGFVLANASAVDGVDFYCSTFSKVKQRPMLTVVYE